MARRAPQEKAIASDRVVVKRRRRGAGPLQGREEGEALCADPLCSKKGVQVMGAVPLAGPASDRGTRKNG